MKNAIHCQMLFADLKKTKKKLLVLNMNIEKQNVHFGVSK